MPQCLTLVAIGDKMSKKTELLIKYTGGHQHIDHPTQPRFSDTVEDIIVDSRSYRVRFIDGQSDDDYKILRKNCIEQADCVLLCFSIGDRGSFQSLIDKWCIEIRKYSSFVPIVLVGTESELRKSHFQTSIDCVSFEEGHDLKCLIGAFEYVECSLETSARVDDVFIEAIRSTRRFPLC